MFTDYNDRDPGYPDNRALAAHKLMALQEYRHNAELDSSDDESYDGSQNGSLENIYDEIAQLQMVVAQQRAAPPPPPSRPQIHYPQGGGDVILPSITSSGSAGDHDQIIVLKNLPKANDADNGPFIDGLVIKEDVNVEYDAIGAPYVVPRPAKPKTARILNVPNPNEGQGLDASQVHAEVPLGREHTLQIDNLCPQHGLVQQHCGVQQMPVPVCQAHGPGGGHHVVQPRQVVVTKRRVKKPKTLFEKLISG